MAAAHPIDLKQQAKPSPFDDPPGSAVGSVVSGFVLTAFLGRGGMADVYAARHQQTGARVALKRMLPWLVQRRHFVELFFHEARIYGSLEHPNIVQGLDVCLDEGVPVLVLELVDGCSCRTLLRESGAFPLGVAMAVAHEVLAALTHVHEARDHDGRELGIVHGDIASDNVMISRDGRVKLLDFGVAHSRLTGGPMNPTELRGRIGYAAPEHLAGMPTNARSDLFSVGALLAEMSIGKRVFASASRFQTTVLSFNVDDQVLATLDAHVPEPLRQVLAKALSRDRGRRFASAREFSQALEHAAREMARGMERRQIHDWISRRSIPPVVSGEYRMAEGPAAGELHAKIEVVADELEHNTPPTASGGSGPVRISVPEFRPPEYRVRVGRYAEVRTLTHAELIGAIVTRRIDRHTSVSAVAAPWIPVGEVPGFSQLFADPAYRVAVRRGDAWRPLDRRELPKLLFRIARGRERGMLEARCGSRWKRIFFDGGLPVYAASNDESELLGNCVRRLGVVSQFRLDGLISSAFFQGRRLGDVLVDARVMNPAEMLRLLVHQLEGRLLELGTWTGGEIVFVRGESPSFVAPKPLGSPMRLACQLVRFKYCDEEVLTFLRQHGAVPLRLVSSLSQLSGVLTPAEAHVLGHLVAPHTLPSLARHTQLRPEVIRRAAFLGLSAGVVEPVRVPNERAG
jgi:serine/threonine-protein kinase